MLCCPVFGLFQFFAWDFPQGCPRTFLHHRYYLCPLHLFTRRLTIDLFDDTNKGRWLCIPKEQSIPVAPSVLAVPDAPRRGQLSAKSILLDTRPPIRILITKYSVSTTAFSLPQNTKYSNMMQSILVPIVAAILGLGASSVQTVLAQDQATCSLASKCPESAPCCSRKFPSSSLFPLFGICPRPTIKNQQRLPRDETKRNETKPIRQANN